MNSDPKTLTRTIDTVRNTSCDNLVNYLSGSTTAENEFYASPTDDPESLAFQIRNNVLVGFFLEPQNPDTAEPAERTTVSVF